MSSQSDAPAGVEGPPAASTVVPSTSSSSHPESSVEGGVAPGGGGESIASAALGAGEAASGGAAGCSGDAASAFLRQQSEGKFAPPDVLFDAKAAAAALVPDCLRENVQLVVWDFDQTVLRIHSWALQIQPEGVPTRDLDVDFADRAFFVQVVRALQEAGVRVAIASFGKYETIQAYMNRLFEDEVTFTRETISTPSQVGSRDGYSVDGGKNRQLRKFVEDLGVEPTKFLFFDGACVCGLGAVRRRCGLVLPQTPRLCCGRALACCRAWRVLSAHCVSIDCVHAASCRHCACSVPVVAPTCACR